MKVYRSRTDPEFQKRLRELLSINEKNGLKDDALETDEPIETGHGREFTHCITLDYLGGSASELFDRPGVLVNHCCYDELEELLHSAASLNEDGFFLKIRLLLLYPYSAAGQIRIQAEDSHIRSAVNTPAPHRRQQLLEPDQGSILGSNFLGRVEQNLSILHELVEGLGESHPIDRYPNMLKVRFTPVNPMTWSMRINDNIFYQPYIYGKEDRFDGTSSSHELPVVEINDPQELSYKLLLDHFRYLWEYDAAIFGEDAIDWQTPAAKIKTPNELTFSEKATSQVSEEEGATEEKIIRRSEELQARLEPHCPDLVTPPDKEIAFISASWSHDSSRADKPLPDALILESLIRDFFHERQTLDDVRDIDPKLVNTPPGERFTEEVYSGLEEATMGIIILTPEISSTDIPGPISSPNVYHELGYLMSKLPDNRVYVFTSADVTPPSNIKDKVHIHYSDMYEGFVELLIALEKNNVISKDELENVSNAYYRSLKDIDGVDDKMRGSVQHYIDQRIS